MKKFYLIALCAVISSVAYAQSGSQFANKRLVSFTEESGNSKRNFRFFAHPIHYVGKNSEHP